jgi:hypothetical protein
MVTLWSISRSPLFMGGNLTHMDAFTASLLTNAEVIAVNQQGHAQRQAAQDGDVIAWTSQGSQGQEYLALFNLGDTAARVSTSFDHYGLGLKSYALRNLWDQKDLGRAKSIAQTLPPHGSVLLALHP